MNENIDMIPIISSDSMYIGKPKEQVYGGFLKKLSKYGFYSTKWFWIPINLNNHENYSLYYANQPNDKVPKRVFPCYGAKIVVLDSVSFTFHSFGLKPLTLKCRDEKELIQWTGSLAHVIAISDMRGEFLNKKNELLCDDSTTIPEEKSISSPSALKSPNSLSILSQETSQFFHEVRDNIIHISSPNKVIVTDETIDGKVIINEHFSMISFVLFPLNILQFCLFFLLYNISLFVIMISSAIAMFIVFIITSLLEIILTCAHLF